MQRRRFITLGTLSLFMIGSLGVSSGCGESNSTEPMSAETKKADQGAQDGMKEFMQGKNKPKGKSK